MIKVSKLVGDNLIEFGKFKSYVAFADFLDENPKENIGTYYVVPPNCARVGSITRVDYDGALVYSERHGNI